MACVSPGFAGGVRTWPTGAALMRAGTAPQRPGLQLPVRAAPGLGTHGEGFILLGSQHIIRHGKAPFQTFLEAFHLRKALFQQAAWLAAVAPPSRSRRWLRAGSGCQLRVHLRARGGLKEPFMLSSGLGDNNGAAV